MDIFSQKLSMDNPWILSQTPESCPSLEGVGFLDAGTKAQGTVAAAPSGPGPAATAASVRVTVARYEHTFNYPNYS